MNNIQTTTQVICVKSEYGVRENKVYTQIDRYEVYPGYWVRTIINNQGMKQNYEDHYFKDVEETN